MVSRQIDSLMVGNHFFTPVQILDDDALFGETSGKTFCGRFLFNAEFLAAPFDQTDIRIIDMPFIRCLVKKVKDTGSGSCRRVRLKSQFFCHFVGFQETDSHNIHGQLIGTLRDNLQGFFAVAPVNLRGISGTDAVALQKYEKILDVPVGRPSFFDHLHPLGTQAGDGLELLRFLFDDVQRPGAEGLNDPPGHFRADPFD